MALANYTDLQSTIAETLNRDDLASSVPVFIALAQAAINRDVRHWRMETRTSGQQSAGDAYMQVPADWVETARFSVVGNGTSPISMISSAAMSDVRAKKNDQYNTPKFYSLEAGQFHLYPTPIADTDVELLYFAQVPDLALNSTNWLLTVAPDVYLYGSLIHSAPYLQDDARLAVWAQLYSAAVTRLNESSKSAKYSGVSLVPKIRGLA